MCVRQQQLRSRGGVVRQRARKQERQRRVQVVRAAQPGDLRRRCDTLFRLDGQHGGILSEVSISCAAPYILGVFMALGTYCACFALHPQHLAAILCVIAPSVKIWCACSRATGPKQRRLLEVWKGVDAALDPKMS